MIRLVLEISDMEYVELVDLLEEYDYFGGIRRIKEIIEASTVLKEDLVDGHLMKTVERK